MDSEEASVAEAPKEPRGFKAWFFTWNNPPLSGPDFLAGLKALNVKRTIFQLEKAPGTGTLHFQGGAEWSSQMRGSTLTKRFKGIWLDKLMDWSMAYGRKTESRVDGPWAFGCVIPRPILFVERDKMYPWQAELFDRLKEPCLEDRKVLWVWERDGCRGKSSLIKSLQVELGADSVLSLGGDEKDIMFAIRAIVKPQKGPQTADLRVVAFDFERGHHVPYDAFGPIKNGSIFSPKYESCNVLFSPVHVVCFANFPPDMDRISADRWEIIDLNV